MPKSKPATPAAEVDAQLARYRAMRDFSTTAEPSGGSDSGNAKGAPWAPPEGLPFVIQKHAATRLHYDFRLGWRGVLKSWACAKGPSYNTHDKRLAVEVEDHPMEYGGFEGAIPKGQYGGGTVLVWDQGTWEPLPGHDFDEGLRKGALKFTLHGHKLEGRWTLVRMHSHPPGHVVKESKPNWLLIKEHDGNERADAAPSITDEAPNSVVTGRSLEEIAAAEDHVWQSREADNAPPASNRSRLQAKIQQARRVAVAPATGPRSAGSATTDKHAEAAPGMKFQAASGKRAAQARGSAGKATKTRSPRRSSKDSPKASSDPILKSTTQAWLDSAPREQMPAFLPPQLATAASTIPPGTGWLHELKLDGYRIQAHIGTNRNKKREATLYTRSGLDWTHRMRAVANAMEKVPVDQSVIDGELVILDESGQSSFSKLQTAFEHDENDAFTYCAFDLLHLNGSNLRGLPLHARKALLEPLIAGAVEDAAKPLLLYSQHLTLSADEVYAHACQLGAEGILSKQIDARYTAGRSESWLKLKCTHRQEFVIGGFTLPKDVGQGLGSLLLGYYDRGKLIHCGRCGTGFNQTTARELRALLEPLRQPKSPYSNALDYLARRGAVYVRPEIVCEVQFATWTADGAVRHASFQGLRADKPAAEVVKEEPALLASDETGPESRRSEQSETKSSKRDSPAPTVNLQPSFAAQIAEPAVHLEGSGKSATKRAASAATKPVTSKLTHPDKLLDQATGLTKQQLADYYEAVAPAMLPHLAERAISIVRCPDGSTEKCFFQKHVKIGLPKSVGSVEVPDKANPAHSEPYITLDSAEALLGLAQLSVLELHPWGSQYSLERPEALEQPDRLILDLDPDPDLAWSTLVESALAIRAFLKELQLESFVKTTGGKGLHIVVALEPAAHWPEIRLFSRGIAAAIESTDPKLYLIKMIKAARTGRIFIDWMRNERGATAVAPWSPRARAGMRVAVPLKWDELKAGLPAFSVANFADWRDRADPRRNPWAAMKPQRLDPEILRTVVEQAAAAEKQARRH